MKKIEGIIPDYIWKDGLVLFGHTGGNPVWRLPVAGREYMHIVYAISILLSAQSFIFSMNY